MFEQWRQKRHIPHKSSEVRIMNHASNTSGSSATTQTTITLLDDANSSLGGSSIISNGHNGGHSSNPSISSRASTCSRTNVKTFTAGDDGGTREVHQIFNYKEKTFVPCDHRASATCEELCMHFCRSLMILPTTRLLFGLRVYDKENEWAPPGRPLRANVRYVFRMRFKVPALDTNLQSLDPNAYEYLYRQMRYDMVHEHIPEIRYPAKKDNVVGLAVVNMCIDLLEQQRENPERIESNYKNYLPRQIIKAHKIFVKSIIRDNFRQFLSTNIELGKLKWNFVHEIHNLAPNYLMETFRATYKPEERECFDSAEGSGVEGSINSNAAKEADFYVKLDLHDTPEPGMKVARTLTEDKSKWTLVAKLENIYALHTEEGATTNSNASSLLPHSPYQQQQNLPSHSLRLEITGFPNGYRMQFGSKVQMESFITYLAGYIRLTSKWMLNLCAQYVTPSLQELKDLHCHGPIGGSYSFNKIREKRNKCGTYIIRQCEKEYDIYYIDINTKSADPHLDKCKTETFKISRTGSLWILHYNDSLLEFHNLIDLAHHIPTEMKQKFRIPPSEYDKPPLLLICLPKNLQTKKAETELSESELQNRRPQIFDPKKDLQWYKNSSRDCDNGKMRKVYADWIQQQDTYKEVCVTLKVLKSDADFTVFMKLSNQWSQIYSPHFLKLYGITLSTPHTMVMEHSRYGPLNEFLLRHKEKIPMRSLLDVILGLVRGVYYLKDNNFIHGYIRCANLYVTKYDPKTNFLQAKIADPGYPRPYSKEDLPWIPFEYYNNLQAAKDRPNVDAWAFATTVWEIFARGKPITNMTVESLCLNYNHYGGILPPEDVPEEMYRILMDGWNKEEPEKRFNHQDVFSVLYSIDRRLATNYISLSEGPTETLSDASSLHSSYSNITDNAFNGLNNGHSSISDIRSCTLSSNSTTCDRAPLINHQQTTHNSFQQSSFAAAGGISKSRHGSYFDDTPSVLQIPNGKVIWKVKDKIGEGHYGSVYLGHIRYNSGHLKVEKVAIKTLKSARPTQLNKDFMREIQIMQTLDHPNIVKIKHWVEEPISIIMEFVECGSFIDYLKSNKPNLTNETLLRFASDIAKGMDYLRNQKVIHRDLAARNILVDRDRVKISDFGLAQIANSDGYYFGQSMRDIPIKWYSPESIKTQKFSFQSDVWSYGVILFEMFSRGEEPNLDPENNLTQEEFLNRLESGDRLRKPDLCPDSVYEKLMLPCWNGNPKKRLDFKCIIEEIESIQSESGEAI